MIGTLIVMATAAVAQPATAQSMGDMVLGTWKTESRNGIVEIARCGNSICGKLVSSDGMRTNPGLKDANNKDEKLRGRVLKGTTILQGFTPAERGVWDGGTIYNAEDGKIYKARITPVDANHLKVRGCVFVPLCKTQDWVRVR